MDAKNKDKRMKRCVAAGRRVINISRVWMGKVVGRNDVYELKEIDAERIRMEKEHLPRMEEIIRKYEEENGKITKN